MWPSNDSKIVPTCSYTHTYTVCHSHIKCQVDVFYFITFFTRQQLEYLLTSSPCVSPRLPMQGYQIFVQMRCACVCGRQESRGGAHMHSPIYIHTSIHLCQERERLAFGVTAGGFFLTAIPSVDIGEVD